MRGMSNPAASIEVFRAGKHVALDGTEHEITERDLLDAAEQYDPALSEAPLVVGHPKLNAPAYGWANRVFVDQGVLRIEPHQVDPAFAELVNNGRFKKVSASFYLPNSPSNPKPGKLYLRHVGFLGAQPPAVKGLRDASFGESSEGVVEFGAFDRWYVFRDIAGVFRRIRDAFIERDGAEKTDQLIPAWMVDSIADAASPPPQVSPAFSESEDPMTDRTAEFAERDAALNARDTELRAREAAIQEREAQARRDDIAAFAEGLVAEGRLLPRQKAVIVELLANDAGAAEIEFAEGDQTIKKSRLDAWREFLGELPKVIDFSEKAGGQLPGDDVSFASPDNALVNTEKLETHRRALAYQAQNPNTSYLDAVAAVSR